MNDLRSDSTSSKASRLRQGRADCTLILMDSIWQFGVTSVLSDILRQCTESFATRFSSDRRSRSMASSGVFKPVSKSIVVVAFEDADRFVIRS